VTDAVEMPKSESSVKPVNISETTGQRLSYRGCWLIQRLFCLLGAVGLMAKTAISVKAFQKTPHDPISSGASDHLGGRRTAIDYSISAAHPGGASGLST
jgi:hypothetical protein